MSGQGPSFGGSGAPSNNIGFTPPGMALTGWGSGPGMGGGQQMVPQGPQGPIGQASLPSLNGGIGGFGGLGGGMGTPQTPMGGLGQGQWGRPMQGAINGGVNPLQSAALQRQQPPQKPNLTPGGGAGGGIPLQQMPQGGGSPNMYRQ